SFCTYFFFSSRRRHTRSKRDWSSDVCSSDLSPVAVPQEVTRAHYEHVRAVLRAEGGLQLRSADVLGVRHELQADLRLVVLVPLGHEPIEPFVLGGAGPARREELPEAERCA